MELNRINLYKYFLSGYHYFHRLVYHYWNRFLGFIIMGGLRLLFFVFDNSLMKNLQQKIKQYRQRKEDIRTEPETKEAWICVSEMTWQIKQPISHFLCWKTQKDTEKTYSLQERYIIPSHSFSSCKKEKRNENTVDTLYLYCSTIKKMKGGFVSPVSFQEFLDKVDTVLPSKVNFLDIQYTHPQMSQPLVLEIPRDYFYDGNELFSPAFVQRLLYYQPYPFVFDMDYSLEIMDKDLNTLCIRSHQMIRLGDTGYSILDL